MSHNVQSLLASLLILLPVVGCGEPSDGDATPTFNEATGTELEAFGEDWDAFDARASTQEVKALAITSGNLSTLQKGCLGSGSFLKWSWDGACPPGYYGGTSLSAAYKKAVTVNGYAGTQVADNNNGYWGECVSLVKSLTKNNTATSGWVQGNNVVAKKDVEPGKVVATFSNGKYVSGSGHAAIFAGYQKDGSGKITGIKLWSQNWGARVVQYHTLSTSGNGLSDADSYFVIKVNQ